jgi:hypothetical protein
MPEVEQPSIRTRREIAARQALDNLVKKSSYFYHVFTSPDGKKVLEALESEFNSDSIFVPMDPHATAYNLGKRDVIIYINQLIRMKENAARAEQLERQSAGRIEGAQDAG